MIMGNVFSRRDFMKSLGLLASNPTVVVAESINKQVSKSLTCVDCEICMGAMFVNTGRGVNTAVKNFCKWMDLFRGLFSDNICINNKFRDDLSFFSVMAKVNGYKLADIARNAGLYVIEDRDDKHDTIQYHIYDDDDICIGGFGDIYTYIRDGREAFQSDNDICGPYLDHCTETVMIKTDADPLKVWFNKFGYKLNFDEFGDDIKRRLKNEIDMVKYHRLVCERRAYINRWLDDGGR